MNTSLRPKVRLHYAQTLDGRIGWFGMQTRLSSSEGLVLAHVDRAQHDAVLIGGGTLRIDDPCLTVRECDGPQPRRVVLSRRLEIAPTARILGPGGPLMVIGLKDVASQQTCQRLAALGAEVRVVPADDFGLLSLPAVLRELHAWGVERLLVEGGATVLTSFLRQRLADEATIEIAPHLFGEQGLSALGRVTAQPCQPTPRLSRLTIERAGESVMVRGALVY